MTVTGQVIAYGPAAARRLLAGAAPMDAAAHRGVDEALCRGSNDPGVHAAALLLAFSAGEDLRLERSQAKRWALGLDELIDCGHLEAAAHAARRLDAAYPSLPYLAYMTLVFRRLPAAVEGRQRFVDDRTKDVQLVPVPGADTLVVAFCGIGNRLGLSLSLIDRWFGQLGSHVVYLRDRRKLGFTGGIPSLGRDMAATIGRLETLADGVGARRIVCTGNSAGGSGALRSGRALGAERVLALAPITGGRDYEDTVRPHLRPGEAMPWTDLVPLYRDGAGPRVRVLYGAQNQGDRQQCERMAGLPNVTVEAISDWDSHHLVGGLLRAGRLQRVLSWLR
jgi:hypothetical protein